MWQSRKGAQMKKFLAFIVLSNLIAVACVYLFEFSFGYLKIAFLKDYAFYSMLIQSVAIDFLLHLIAVLGHITNASRGTVNAWRFQSH